MILRSWTRSADAPSPLAHVPDDALVLAEAPGTVALAYRGDLPEAAWRRGDAFTPDWHLRWRQLGSRLRWVVAGPAPGSERWGTPDATLDLSEAETEERRLVLWGRRNKGEELWLELRIPHLMTPPLHHPRGHGADQEADLVRRVLTARTYRDPETGAVLFHRFTGLAYAPTNQDDTAYAAP